MGKKKYILYLSLLTLTVGSWKFIVLHRDYSHFFDYEKVPLSARVKKLRSTETYVQYDVKFKSLNGEDINALINVPTLTPPPHPTVILIDGIKHGRRVVDYLSDEVFRRGYAVISIDYRYSGSKENVLAIAFQARGAAKGAIFDIRRTIDYLETRDDIDKRRIGLMGTSLGALLAPLASADDERVKVVILIHGGGDLIRLVKGGLKDTNFVLRYFILLLGKLLYDPFEPLNYVERISPRPLLMINGRDDKTIPEECARALYEKAGDPKQIIWREKKHIKAKDTAEIDTLIAKSLNWLDARL